MPLTQFPIITTDPTVPVTLPVGRHELELVVEDSAGLRSAPDTVVLTVVYEPTGPVIHSISPTEGRIGSVQHEVLPVTLTGQDLDKITGIQFLKADGEPDRSLSISDLDAKLDAVTAKLEIGCKAVEGDHGIRVITEDQQQGILVEGCRFKVLDDDPPTIRGIVPDFATCGDRGKDVTITGTNLACVEDVTFDGTGVTVVIAPHIPDEQSIPVKVSVQSTAQPVTGNLVVRTPNNPTASGAFKICAMQAISEIVPASSSVGWHGEVTIKGTGLAGTGEKGLRFFTFPLVGGEPHVDKEMLAEVLVDESSDNEVKANLAISSGAAKEKHGFIVLASAGPVKSWEQTPSVYFTVE
jgi:hypothetical protein